MNCPDQTTGAKPVHFGTDLRADLYGLVFGTGKTGVVISHMNGGDVCQGTPFGKELAQAGYRVLVFDFAGFGVSSAAAGVTYADQVKAAAAALRADGATSIVLLGGSMGATATLAAAPGITPPPAAVVALSPPLLFSNDNAEAGAAKLSMPVLYAAGALESEYPENIAKLAAETPKNVPHQTVLGEASLNHGLYLTDPAIGVPGVRTAVEDFLKKYAPAS
ncbi:alpha/beta hydrolase [Hamadaea tsunoensis]|uniref:alpha/beta hydrolase n=1 Tax=Hamadaea tsunoensis TaxID=53368 RepID=UPI00146FB9E8|nr:alpha/beta hydrolase [Hamadaea tsunoensis]